jgi:uncharacterized protein
VRGYSLIDESALPNYIFYPRSDFTPPPAGAFDLRVPVEPDVHVSCRFHIGDAGWPLILYFHGNGEVVSDYDQIAPFYRERRLNLAVADYRGYGASNGSPSLSAMLSDSHRILAAVKEETARRGIGNGLWIMGRSLGSLSAAALASLHRDDVKGLIIESGFGNILTITVHLGLPLPEGLDMEKIERESLEVVGNIRLRTLIIHGEYDTLVPLSEAQKLYDNLGSAEKHLLVIQGADHNDIMFTGFNQYFDAIGSFVEAG